MFRSTVAQISFIDWALHVKLYKYIRNYKQRLDNHNRITVKHARKTRQALQHVIILIRWIIKYIHNRDITPYTPNKRRLIIKEKSLSIFAGTSFSKTDFFFDSGNKWQHRSLQE